MTDLSKLMQNAAILEVMDKSADECSMLSAQNSAQAMRIDELELENAALRTDAERYRWLRGNVFVDVIEDDGRYWTVRLGDEKELDTAIDAARKERP